MSYCVNCGVELAPSETACPLCGVVVNNPLQPAPAKVERPYPLEEDPVNVRTNRRFIAAILSILLALPVALCLAIEFTFSARLNWSLYVAGSLAMIWLWIVPPFLLRKATFLPCAVIDAGGILAFLRLIEALQSSRGWFWPLAFPIVVLVAGLVIIVVSLTLRRLLRGFQIPSALLTIVGLQAVGIELIINLSLDHRLHLAWSWFVLIPCLALAAASLAVSRRQKVRDEILKRLHL